MRKAHQLSGTISLDWLRDSQGRAAFLDDVRRDLAFQPAFPEAIGRALDRALELGACSCGIWGWNEGSGEFDLFQFEGSEESGSTPVPTTVNAVLRGKERGPLALFGARRVERAYQNCLSRSVVSAPIWIRDRLMGVLGLFGARASGPLRPDLEQIVREMANVIADEMGRRLVRVIGSHHLEKGDYELSWVLGRRAKWCVFLFADMRGFTPLADLLTTRSERISKGEDKPIKISALINQYLSDMTRIGWPDGRIDKFMGDGVMMVFGDLRREGDEQQSIALKALCAATRMQASFKRLVEQWEGEWIQRFRSEFNEDVNLKLGIGISCGPATFDFYGSDMHREYSAIGDPVNVAARLEKQVTLPDNHGKICEPILISQTMFARAGDFLANPVLHLLDLKGKGHTVRAYGVTGFNDRLCSSNGVRCSDCKRTRASSAH